MTRSTSAALAAIFFAGVLAAPCPARAAVPAAPTRWVTDTSGFLSDAARRTLDGRLKAYQQQTGHHLLVWIGTTTGGVPIEDFAVQAFAAWKVGRKGLDDGLVLFVFSDDRQLRIEVGYGLEGQVPDATASRIIREAIVPRIQAGDRDGAITAGVDALTAAIEGRAWAGTAAPGRAPPSRSKGPPSIAQLILIGLIVVGFLILLATNPSLAIYLLFSVMSRGGGGGSGGGGGYSGGGGRSGGGGASGSW